MSVIVPANPATWNVLNAQTTNNAADLNSNGRAALAAPSLGLGTLAATFKANLLHPNTVEVVTPVPAGIELKVVDARSTVLWGN